MIEYLFTILMLFQGCNADQSYQQEESTTWWGPYGNGTYPDTGLLKGWPEDGPEILWTFDGLGIGFSSAVIQNDCLFTTGMVDGTGYLYKLNMQGELIYKVAYGDEWTGSYPGTRASPTLVGNKVYLVSGMGKMICFNNDDGTVLWSKDYFSDFDGKNIMWGINEIPLVKGDLIYATPGGKKYNVVALNRHTGDLVWSSRGEGDLSAYSTPILIEHNGRKIMVTFTASHLLGIDPASGKLYWSFDVPWQWSVHYCTPLYKDGEIFYPTGNEIGGGKIKLSEDGNSVSKLWDNQIDDEKVSAILVDGYIYESNRINSRFNWRCVDWETGKEVFFSRDLAPGRVLYADGLLYIYTHRGELALVKPDPAKLNVISRTKVTLGSGLHLSQPLLHQGILYVRHGNTMIAYNVKSGIN